MINEYKVKIEDKYPLYTNKNSEEKAIIINQIAQRNGFGDFIKNVLKCTLDDFVLFGVCVEVTARWRNVTFIACVTGNALADVALVIESAGLGSPNLLPELESGTLVCARMLYGAIGESCTVALALGIAAEILGAFSC
jgi:hypothetical protein